MRLVAERIAVTALLADKLKDATKVTKADLEEVKLLMADEQESMEKSARIANTTTYADNYRRNMKVAVQNSQAVLDLLGEAAAAIRARDPQRAALALQLVVDKRGKRAAQPRGDGALAKLYAQYLAETDQGFRKWLAERGHELPDVAVKPSKTKATRPSSNRPEDY